MLYLCWIYSWICISCNRKVSASDGKILVSPAIKMSASSSEGRYEIEAARQRLASAKKQASAASSNMDLASKTMEAARIMMENAKSLLENSSKEVDAAKKCLLDEEKRWEVIEIDDSNDNTQENESHKKRKRKTSVVSPQEGNNAYSRHSRNNTDDGRSPGDNSAATTTASSTAPAVTPGRERAIGASATTPAASSSSISNNVTRVVVEGCGISVVNGTYTQVVELLNDGAPSFWKKGWWGGKLCKHAIYRRKFNNTNIWVFGYLDDEGGGRSMKRLYTSRVNANSLTPPEDGWDAFVGNGGVYPPPKCRMIYDNDTTAGGVGVRGTATPSSSTATTASSSSYNADPRTGDVADQIVVEGCGNTEINGTYNRVVGVRNEGAPVYRKGGKAIYRGSLLGTNYWYVGHCNAANLGVGLTFTKQYKVQQDNANCMLPPENGWYSIGVDADPAPKCRINNLGDIEL